MKRAEGRWRDGEAVEEAIREYVTNFKINDYEIKKILDEVVKERTRELLRTTFAHEVDALANRAAARVVDGFRPQG